MSQGFTSQLPVPLPTAQGGTGLTSTTAYAVLCGGTTSTGNLQSIASVGTTGQVLTSNGAGALPTFQAISPSGGKVGAWVLFNGTGTPAVTASGNVTSITDNGVGLYTINITTALTSANYAISGSASGGTATAGQVAIFSSDDGNAARTTTAFRVVISQPGGTSANYYDSATISAVATL